MANEEPKDMDVEVDQSTEGLLVIHAWRWGGYMDNPVAIGGDKDLLIKEVCAQRTRVRELEDQIQDASEEARFNDRG
jgi:hypothetical protein